MLHHQWSFIDSLKQRGGVNFGFVRQYSAPLLICFSSASVPLFLFRPLHLPISFPVRQIGQGYRRAAICMCQILDWCLHQFFTNIYILLVQICIFPRFNEYPMTQKEAVNFCENEVEVPAHLVEINSAEENKAVQAEMNRRPATYVWLGIIYVPSCMYHG